MESHKKIIADHVLLIQPITLTLFQYFSLNDIYAFSVLNQSTAKMTTLFIKNKSLKNNINLAGKSLYELQNDAKKLQENILFMVNDEERKTIQILLKKVEEGKADDHTYMALKALECPSYAQEWKKVAHSTWNWSKQYQDALRNENRELTRHDLYLIALAYGISGFTHLMSVASSAFYTYFPNPIESIHQKFKNRIEFFSKNFDEDKKNQAENSVFVPR